MLCTNQESTGGSFRFPATFSSSLRLIVIQDIVLKVVQTPHNTESFSCNFQPLSASGCRHNGTNDPFLWPQPAPVFSEAHSGIEPHARHSLPNHNCYGWYRYQFSPDEKFLVVIEGDGPPGECEAWRKWIITVHESKFGNAPEPNFSVLSRVAVQFRSLSYVPRRDNMVKSLMCFHPSLPVLAICTQEATSLWHFTAIGKSTFRYKWLP